ARPRAKDDGGLEVAALAGQALIDRVSNQVGEPAPVALGDGKALRGELAGGIDIPQAKLTDQASVARPSRPANQQRLGIEHAPIGKAWGSIQIARPIDKGGGIERLKETRALQIGGDDLGDIAGKLPILARELPPAD